jgi:hypothetical protein
MKADFFYFIYESLIYSIRIAHIGRRIAHYKAAQTINWAISSTNALLGFQWG